jgi:hypothetical protein
VKLFRNKDVIHRSSGHVMLSLRNNRSWNIYLNRGDCVVVSELDVDRESSS